MNRMVAADFGRIKLHVFWIVILSIGVIVSCSDPEDPAPTLPPFQEQVIDYFKAVALGYESGGVTEVTRKWRTPMRIYIGGQIDDEYLVKTIEETIEALNELTTDGFQILWENDSSSANTYLFLGDRSTFIQMFPDAAGSLVGNLAHFNVWWNNDNINRARIFIDTESTDQFIQRSLILEEITQSLGIGKDSPKYPESIFYETPSNGGFAQELSPLDREIVRLLYHPQMRVGLNASQVEDLLREILQAELGNA